MKKNLPIYDIVLDDLNLKQGVGFISLVDEPAIMVDWVKLAAESNLSFKADKDKQLLFGPFLIPDMLIYRFDEKLGEYYVRFKKEEIAKIATKFNKDLNNKNINFQHTDTKVEAFVAENWVIDGEDKSKKFGFNLPDGTWFGGVKVEDENFWNDKVKNGEVKGFSVEILAELELSLKNNKVQMENQNEETTNVELAVDPNAAPAADAAPAAEAPAADAPAESKPLTAEEVSQMIDARFSQITEEITALKESVSILMEKVPVEGEIAQNEYKEIKEKITAIEEKLASTPGATSVTKPVVKTALHLDGDKFSKDLERIRQFAKIGK